MSAEITDLAEALRPAFAAGYGATPRRVSQDIDAQRIYVSRPKLDELVPWDHANPAAKAIKVFVLTDDEVMQADEATRDHLLFNYPIIVGIAAKPKTTTPADVDPLCLLRQDLKDFCFKLDPAYAIPGRNEGAVGIETITDMDSESLREKGLFLAEFVITFIGGRFR
jgi:hypothetical protein